MRRSDIINGAFRRIVDGTRDPQWTNEERNDYFHEACDEVHEALVDADLPFYRKSATLTPDDDGLFALPDDFFRLDECEDAQGPLYEVSKEDKRESAKEGIEFFNNAIRMVNASLAPSSIDIIYTAFPKDMGEWTGEDDPFDDATVSTDDTDPDETYVPDYPLNDNRGARLLQRIIVAKAKIKDESLTDTSAREIAGLISKFVDRMGTISNLEPRIVRT